MEEMENFTLDVSFDQARFEVVLAPLSRVVKPQSGDCLRLRFTGQDLRHAQACHLIEWVYQCMNSPKRPTHDKPRVEVIHVSSPHEVLAFGYCFQKIWKNRAERKTLAQWMRRALESPWMHVGLWQVSTLLKIKARSRLQPGGILPQGFSVLPWFRTPPDKTDLNPFMAFGRELRQRAQDSACSSLLLGWYAAWSRTVMRWSQKAHQDTRLAFYHLPSAKLQACLRRWPVWVKAALTHLPNLVWTGESLVRAGRGDSSPSVDLQLVVLRNDSKVYRAFLAQMCEGAQVYGTARSVRICHPHWPAGLRLAITTAVSPGQALWEQHTSQEHHAYYDGRHLHASVACWLSGVWDAKAVLPPSSADAKAWPLLQAKSLHQRWAFPLLHFRVDPGRRRVWLDIPLHWSVTARAEFHDSSALDVAHAHIYLQPLQVEEHAELRRFERQAGNHLGVKFSSVCGAATPVPQASRIVRRFPHRWLAAEIDRSLVPQPQLGARVFRFELCVSHAAFDAAGSCTLGFRVLSVQGFPTAFVAYCHTECFVPNGLRPRRKTSQNF